MGQLTDKVAIVTGANSGIGEAIALAYALEGAKTILAARRADKLTGVAAAITAAGGTALAVETDVTQEDQVIRLMETAKNAYGRIDILVNNAGTATHAKTDELSLAEWRRVIDVNLTGAFLCSREAVKIMKGQGGGRIINIGSVSAKTPRPHTVSYAASKFGLAGLTHSFALDFREYGIAVSILHPGNVASGLAPRGSASTAEARMKGADVARLAVLIAALPPDTNLLESVMLPVDMPFLGRG